MSIKDLIEQFERLGVELFRNGEELRFRAPQGVLTNELKRQLSERKAEILHYLAEQEAATTLTLDPAGRFSPFPLTEAQSAYLLGRHQAYAFGGVACRGYLEIEFPGSVTTSQLEHAWHELIRRHDVMRLVVEEEGFQRVLPEVSPAPLPVDDLTALDAEQVARHTEAVRDAMLARPVDYAHWPLFEVRLCRCRDRILMLLAIELVLVDAASLYRLVDELDRLVTSDELPAAPQVTYRDYVIAQRAQRQGGRYRRDRDYWLARLDSLPAAPELPLTRALPLRAGPDSGRFQRRSLVLDERRANRLRAVAAGLDTTLNALMLGIFAETLGAWCQTRRFTLNLPIFRREPLHPEIDRVVGDFTSMLLLEIDLDARATFGERIKSIGRQLFDDLDHASFSGFEMLGELTRQCGAPVLMPVVFTSTVGSGADRRTSARCGKIVHGLTQTPQVSIDCQLTEQASHLMIAWDVREGLFPPDMVDCMFVAFCRLTERLSDGETAELDAASPVLIPKQQLAVRQTVNSTERPHEAMLLQDGLLYQADRYPERPAIRDGQGTLSYGEWLLEARKLATGLLEAGCRPGDRVAILRTKGRGQAIAVLAVLLCGGCYVPIDVDQPAARREAILADASIRIAIAEGGCVLPDSVCRVEPHRDAGVLPSIKTQPHEPAYVIYTSGSTGVPKGVVMSHGAAWNTVADINRRFGVTEKDSILALASLGFDLSVYDLFGLSAAGGILVYPEEERKSDPSHWAELMARHDVTLWNSVPAQLQMLCDAIDGGAPPPAALRLAMVSGDWVPLDLAQRLHRHSAAAQLISLGGATEAAIWSVIQPVENISSDWISIPYGKPLANQRLHVVDGLLQERPDWAVGQIAISGQGLALGYFNDPEKTAKHFVHRRDGERLYLTGDLGRCWPDGTIELLGRLDSQVKIRGHRVELGEIASTLRSHPSVSDAQVLLADGPGRALHAFTETARGVQPNIDEAVASMHLCAADIEQRIDREAFRELMTGADRVAMLAMAAQLRADGLFATSDSRHDLTQIYRATRTVPVHQRLLRRWLDGLVDAGALSCDPQGIYTGLIDADVETVRQAWATVDLLEKEAGYGSQTLHYVRVCADQLSGLLRGEVDVRALLFPQGEMQTAHAAYRDNLVSRSMNSLVVEAVRALAERKRGHAAGAPLRLLEVGAGVAGTASDLVPALADHAPEYWFTDLSEFFLSEARKQFADYAWMRYGIFDMNRAAWPQGMAPNSFDVIVCANVLHNARHAGEVLHRFAELLAPGGCVVFIEPFRRHNYPLLVSMEFFPELTGFTDLRAETDQTFFTREQWLTWLRDAGASTADCAPASESALATAGQGVFVAQFKTDRADICAEALSRYLAARLPAYMVPARLIAMDALPRLRNGKSDRAALRRWIPADHHPSGAPGKTGAQPRDALEHEIVEVWAEILGVAEPACDVDFYALGGDSLLLSRMIARVRRQIPAAAALEWEILLRHLLREPTIRSLADRLRDGVSPQSAEHAPASALVSLWGSGQQSGRTCVLVHAGTGNLLPYQHLLAALDRSSWARGIGVELPSHDLFKGLDPERALTLLASRYADELAGQGDQFTLIGYCMGGLLAGEIARVLTERGKTVNELVAISAYQPPRVESEPLVDYVFARAIGARPEQLDLPDEAKLAAAVTDILRDSPDRIAADAFSRHASGHREVADAFAGWQGQSAERRLARLASAGQADGIYHEPEAARSERFAQHYALFAHSMASVGRYRPDAWLGRTVLLRNSASDPLLPGTPADVARYWQGMCLGELIVEDIPGDHFSCLSQAHAANLAARIVRHAGRGA